MLAIILSIGRSSRARAVCWGIAATVVLLAGASRIYLAAHWPTDVLGGYALGATWVALIVAVGLVTTPRGDKEIVDSSAGDHDRQELPSSDHQAA